MSNARVYLGKSAQKSSHNSEKLLKRAEAVASGLTVPSGVKFASFAHEGKTYALSVRLIVDVELLTSRLPAIVLLEGQPAAKIAKARGTAQR
jgi:hypothetical protein